MGKRYPEQLYRIVQFNIVGEFTLELHFDDGVVRLVDLVPILEGPIFGPLRDPHLFAQVSLDKTFGALVWPNGADISPTVLHDWPDHLESILDRHRKPVVN